MVIVKKFHQLLQPLQHRTGRTTTWTSEGCHKVLKVLLFCDSEYDQSVVLISRFLFGQHQERPDICEWHDGTPVDEIETWLSTYMFAEALSKVFDRGKRPFFFLSSVPCLGKGSVLMGLYWLPAGQRVDFKMHSDAFVARLLTSTCRYVSHCPTTDLVKIFSPCRHY